VRIESLVVLFVISSSGCSLIAPGDSELSGAWGLGGRGGFPASETGGHANDAGEAAGSDTGGSDSMSNGGAADAGESGSDAGPSAGNSASGSVGAGTGGVPGAGGTGGSGGKTAAGGGTGGVAGAAVANGGTTASSGGTLGAAGAGGTGKVGGAGGAVSYCAAKPCVRGTCSEVTNGYKCTCPAGWGGATCAVGSCSTLSCPASAPCTVPASNVVAVCYPSACVGSSGLCLAENADGSGDAIIIEGHNPDFNPLAGSNWTNRAKYFGYLDNAHGGYACVFPQPSDTGTPLVIPLNSVRTKTTGFGQSNSWPNPPTCSYP
jgi:hypothetical protein